MSGRGRAYVDRILDASAATAERMVSAAIAAQSADDFLAEFRDILVSYGMDEGTAADLIEALKARVRARLLNA